MRKLLIACLAITLVGLTSVQSQTSGNLVLTGTIADAVSIAVAPTAAASTLNLNTSQTVTVATVTEKCNKSAGYTVALSCASTLSGPAPSNSASSQPKLIGLSPINTESLDYTINYDGYPVTFDNNGTASDFISDETTSTPEAGSSKDLKISYASQYLLAGTYTDTLTLTIAAK